MIEVCCGSFEDAISANKGGAKRVELNSALALGGLTPSTASLSLTKQYLDMEVVAMVRPRAGGFCYSSAEYTQMLTETGELIEAGADGIAFGFLNADRGIDRARTKEFVELIHSYDREAVFHRAFDCTCNVDEGIQTLIALGVDRILTSGLEKTAEEGIGKLAYLQKTYGSQIQILAGCGVNIQNLKRIKEVTHIQQFHSSCKGWKEDATTIGESVSFSYNEGSHKSDYEVVFTELVQALIEIDSWTKA